MPWLETAPMDQRERFISDHQHGLYTMAELCARYGFRTLKVKGDFAMASASSATKVKVPSSESTKRPSSADGPCSSV